MNNCENIGLDVPRKTTAGFKHNWQSLRIACELNSLYDENHGMDLSNFTLWGILHHSNTFWKQCEHYFYGKCFLGISEQNCPNDGTTMLSAYEQYEPYTKINNDNPAWSFEGRLVNLADEIAQRHHDIEDAFIMGILNKKDIIAIFKKHFEDLLEDDDIQNLYLVESKLDSYFLPLISKLIVHFYNKNLINHSASMMRKFMKKYNIKNKTDFAQKYLSVDPDEAEKSIDFPRELKEADKKFKGFLRDTILNSFWVQRMDGKGLYVIKKLFKAYLTNPNQLHDYTIIRAFNMFDTDIKLDANKINKQELGDLRNKLSKTELKNSPEFQSALLRSICDHIAGMTDSFVISEYNKLYGDAPIG